MMFFNAWPGVGEGVASARGRPELHAVTGWEPSNVCRQYFRKSHCSMRTCCFVYDVLLRIVWIRKVNYFGQISLKFNTNAGLLDLQPREQSSRSNIFLGIYLSKCWLWNLNVLYCWCWKPKLILLSQNANLKLLSISVVNDIMIKYNQGTTPAQPRSHRAPYAWINY